MRAREGHYTREKATLNKKIEGRTRKEWCDDNCEYLLVKQKKYRDTHKDAMNQYRQDNKEHIQQVVNQYIDNNKEAIRQYRKLYNQLTILCECCNKVVNRSRLSTHQKTLKCKSFVKPIENEE